MTFEASCFPLPSFSFAFYAHPVSLVALEQPEEMMSTEKSAALSFRFFALLGITCDDDILEASEANTARHSVVYNSLTLRKPKLVSRVLCNNVRHSMISRSFPEKRVASNRE